MCFEANNKYQPVAILSWNIEGFSRNCHALKHFVDYHKPKLIFLSEPMIFQCDLPILLKPFEGIFDAKLNSEDLFDLDPLILRKRVMVVE